MIGIILLILALPFILFFGYMLCIGVFVGGVYVFNAKKFWNWMLTAVFVAYFYIVFFG
ncbi:hypothetical protein H0X10_04645 [Candidatus Saccharibacteria bacterium]|nr:hypothetical protein [Candidatus Saccharibacteria bacterium]